MISSILKRCFICGNTIRGEYYRDHLNHFACNHHQLGWCFSCYGLCDPKKSVEVEGYGHICPDCVEKSISPADAVKLVGYVYNYYKKLNLSFPAHKLHLITFEEMRERFQGQSAMGLAYNKYDGVYRVCILKNLSKIAFAGVFAHEVLHLWQYGMKINAPDHICEGFCNLGQYMVLSSINNKEEAALRMRANMGNNDMIYGEGFRLMKVIYDSRGWNGVIEEMLKYR